ncbi:MAG: hypothetical protein ACP5OX_01465 [Minisyncoccia bacterium]
MDNTEIMKLINFLKEKIQLGTIKEARINDCIKVDQDGVNKIVTVVVFRPETNIGLELFDTSIERLIKRLKEVNYDY